MIELQLLIVVMECLELLECIENIRFLVLCVGIYNRWVVRRFYFFRVVKNLEVFPGVFCPLMLSCLHGIDGLQLIGRLKPLLSELIFILLDLVLTPPWHGAPGDPAQANYALPADRPQRPH